MDSKEQLLKLLCDIERVIKRRKDTREAQFYEPWDLVLNWLRVRTDLRFTIAPQCGITHDYYDSKHHILAKTPYG